MRLYEIASKIAATQIRRFGTQITLRRDKRVVDPATGRQSSPFVDTHDLYVGYGVVSDFSMQQIANNPNLREGDKLLVCTGIPVPNHDTDSMAINGNVYSVLPGSNVVDPNYSGTAIVIEVPIR